MSRNEQLLHDKPIVAERAFTEKTLVAATLIVFLLMHLFAAAILQRAEASADGPSEQNKALQLYD